jgi:hypothetical protein
MISSTFDPSKTTTAGCLSIIDASFFFRFQQSHDADARNERETRKRNLVLLRLPHGVQNDEPRSLSLLLTG